jgi:hypothetical protein
LATQIMTRERLLLIALLLWGLAMIAPDVLRVAYPLGSFGFYANNDGVIYNVTGPFTDEASSPAWKAGLRIGDRLDLSHLRCGLKDFAACGNALAALGGLQFALPGRILTIDVAATGSRPARQVKLIAAQRPSNFLVRAVLILDQIAGMLVVVAAAWLVWSKPSAMSWGFFLYVNWFNPGQAYVFYAILQQWPVLLIAQDLAGCVAQAAGFVGLLLFVLRVPNNRREPKWRPVERALPFVALVFALALIASYGSVLGYPTETTTRAGIIAGFAVAFCALAILMVRRRDQAPEDYQRVRWVIWGCLIGLPAFLIAELASETAIFDTAWGDFTPSEEIIGLLFLVNGILCLFVFEALRKPRVVSVWIPLRRVTILGFILTAPTLLLHHQVNRIEEHLSLPGWSWVALAVVVSFLISQLHDGTVDIVDRYFNKWLDKVELKLGEAIRTAPTATEVDRVLADESFHALRLTSAASFRQQGSVFSRDNNGKGWDDSARTLKPQEPMLARLAKGQPFSVMEPYVEGLTLPPGLSRPVLAVPAVNPARCFAVSLYGPHTSGTDLDHYERALLTRLAQDAAAMYAELESKELRQKVVSLKRELEAARAASGAGVVTG